MRKIYTANRSQGVEAVKSLLKDEAQKIYREDIAANKQLGKFGANLLRNARHVMTHCNAGRWRPPIGPHWVSFARQGVRKAV
jgi:methylthioribose-1-phosphate isomerase